MRRRGFMTASFAALLATPAVAAPPPVVLELFTSQGCSSCPPADALLGEVSRQPGVIGLAWHVDYWNGLGWRDPFARRAWTDRQRAFAKSLAAEVFTPALVVNGAEMVIGSDRAAVNQAVARAVAPPVEVALHRAGAALEAQVGPCATGSTGLMVVFDPKVVTQVGAGENGGRHLTEYRIVRETVPLAIVPQPREMVFRQTFAGIAETWGAVVLVQDGSGRIVGAAELPPLRPA